MSTCHMVQIEQYYYHWNILYVYIGTNSTQQTVLKISQWQTSLRKKWLLEPRLTWSMLISKTIRNSLNHSPEEFKSHSQSTLGTHWSSPEWISVPRLQSPVPTQWSPGGGSKGVGADPYRCYRLWTLPIALWDHHSHAAAVLGENFGF